MSIMETIKERLEDVDAGVFCPVEGCDPDPRDIVALDGDSRLVIGECPIHGRFAVDVSREYEAELADRIDDERYQVGDQELGLQRDMKMEG